MLNPQAAREALKEFRVKKGAERRMAAVRQLPAAFARAGLTLLDRNDNGKYFCDDEKMGQRREEAARLLDECKPTERRRLFGALLPRLADPLEATWQLLKKGPYHYNSAFRAPHHPEWTRLRRLEWLKDLLDDLEDYSAEHVDVAWAAAWAAHLNATNGRCARDLSFLLAAAMDAGGKEGDAVFDILTASAKGEHDIGVMGRHVTTTLLTASRPEGWELVEKLLLAAQRQEGLRQSILEAIDLAHPEAFRRMLRLIRDHNLTRFSATVRAVDVWLGLRWDSVSTRVVNETIEQLLTFLDDAAARKRAFQEAGGESLYLALWAEAFHDAVAAIAPAAALLEDRKVERRFVAVILLGQLNLPPARPALLTAMEDEDLRVALHAWEGLTGQDDEDESATRATLFDALEKLIARVPEKEKTFKALVWPWATVTANRQELTDQLPEYLGNLPTTRLLPHLPHMSGNSRFRAVRRLGEQKKWDGPTRQALFALVADPSGWVREEALRVLKKCKPEAEEALSLEKALTRKAGAFRRGVLSLLVARKDSALESADRLLASSNTNQRLAGLDLLRLLAADKKHREACQQRASDYQSRHKKLSEEEREQLELVLHPERVAATLDNALGLMDPSQCTPAVPPRKLPVRFMTSAAIGCLKALDALVHKHRETPVPSQDEDNPEELLGNVGYNFPAKYSAKSIAEDVKHLPLREVWEEWWRGRPGTLRDPDGLELVRAAMWQEVEDYDWEEWEEVGERSPAMKAAAKTLAGGQKAVELRYNGVVRQLLGWLRRMHPVAGAVDWLLDALETAYALVPAEVLKLGKPRDNEPCWWEWKPFALWLDALQFNHEPETPAQEIRLWQLLHWRDLAGPERDRPYLRYLLAAYEAGAANEADILDDLLGPRDSDFRWYSRDFDALRFLTVRPPHPVFQRRPELKTLVDRCCARILEMELARGESPTAASQPAREIESLAGLDTLLRLLSKLGKSGFRTSEGFNKQEILTHLVAVTGPAEADTPEAFSERMKAAVKAEQFPTERLIELAFLAPRWVKHVEHFLGWPGFAEAMWWFLAHMPYASGKMEEEFETEASPDRPEEEAEDEDERPSAWEQFLRERTPLTEEEREEGAVDVAWFQRSFAPLGYPRWQALAAAGRFTSSIPGAKKVRYLTDVLLGKAKKRDIVAGVRKNLRESVRLLGLLPLATGERREQDLLSRYRVLQGYRRYARSLSPLSKEGALRSAAIGLENLARTAGYADPIRLEWALEAKSIADLAAGPISKTVEGVTLTLRLDEQAQPELTVQHGDKQLKAIPARLRKQRDVVALTERKTELKRQASRMRESLETAMVRGDVFTGKELRQLFGHPMLVPLLSRLVLLGDGIAGYADKDGKALRHHSGKREPVKDDEQLRLAHPHDLLAGGDWERWQHECFHAERVQPFKQVFRELYVLTAQEKKDGVVSRRYAGQQIQESQGLALFGARGWSTQAGVSKTFFETGLMVSVSFRHHGWTPAQVEGPVLEGVQFRRRGEWKPLPLVEVSPRLFSEVMRDLDLVVSVAHAGGVDPEASASTTEMRAALLRETCELLKLDNVRFKASHVLIDGVLGHYSVHLGSAVVHRQPGGSLCIVPVHAQQRGRLFLPFADDDPKTAEVVSKVLLLARDSDIQDPIILDQIRAKP